LRGCIIDNRDYSYDEVPYESKPFKQSHPDRLRTIALLFGMNPPEVDHCRVLELGSSAGGNIIPMALTLPESEFVGIDLSAREIDEGKETVAALNLGNVRLEQRSILDVDKDFGKFDYIICHGVFSWVPDEVQDKILDICKVNLSKNGVAYVSYNVLPGWHMRRMVREMMLYHTKQFADPNMKVTQARALVDFLVQSITNDKSAYAVWLKEEFELVKKAQGYYLFHEHLENVNEPCYFHQFVARATKKNLQYLGDAEFHTMLGLTVPPKTEETLRKLFPSIINYEQYMDFVRNRMFRQTLLTHSVLPLSRNVNHEKIREFLVGTPASPVDKSADVTSNVVEEYKTVTGHSFKTGVPITKAAMRTLAEIWPTPMRFDDLFETALEKIGGRTGDPTQEAAQRALLGADFVRLYSWGMVELYSWAPPFVTTVSEFPLASPVARLQAKKGLWVSNLKHEAINLDEPLKRMVLLLDGTRDQKAILDGMCELIRNGTLTVNIDGKQADVEKVRPAIEKLIAQYLLTLARSALLLR
jgi:methyltransferase-like protein/2-polyprenyl-3-methyl-5-hydroxy-6-metoxy-1,4-benzoquinol methylase